MGQNKTFCSVTVFVHEHLHIQVQRYMSKGTGAKVQEQTYMCKGTGARVYVQVHRCKGALM